MQRDPAIFHHEVTKRTKGHKEVIAVRAASTGPAEGGPQAEPWA